MLKIPAALIRAIFKRPMTYNEREAVRNMLASRGLPALTVYALMIRGYASDRLNVSHRGIKGMLQHMSE